MNVRSKLALSTALTLLLLLMTFYIGGRVILLRAFRMVETTVLRSTPNLVKTIQGELRQLQQVDASFCKRPSIVEAFQQRSSSFAAQEYTAATLLREDVQLVALTDPAGQIFSAVFLASGNDVPREPSNSLQRHLVPGAPLLNFTNQTRSPRTGMIVIDEGPMLVVVRRLPEDPAQPAIGYFVVGRDLHGEGVVRRLSAALPGLRLNEVAKAERLKLPPIILDPDTGEVSNKRPRQDLLGDRVETSAWRLIGMSGCEARLPVYDVYGRPSVSLVITLPRTFGFMAETTLAWLSLFVAFVGILFIAPLLFLQGKAVLNPLTRLVSEIQALSCDDPAGRRLKSPGNDEFGMVAQAVNVMLGAIERERLQNEKSERWNRALLEASPDVLFLFEKDGRILDVKCPAGSENGLTVAPGHAVGRNLREVRALPPDLLDRLLECIREAVETRQMQCLEFHVMCPDGQDYWGEYRIVRIDDNRVLAFERNMTERNRAERAQRLLQVHIGQKQKMESLGLLASSIAHDFNNILSAILGHAELAAAKMPSDTFVAESLANIRSAAIRGAGLSRQLQAYAGQGTFEFIAVNLNQLLTDMSQLLRSLLSKKATFETTLDPQLPMVNGDPSQVWQVAMNLLLNASESLNDKPGTIQLSTTRFTAGAGELAEFLSAKPLTPGVYAMLEIRDTGHGMPPEVLARIFDPFFSTKSKGRGLGLSAVVGIVQAHEGGIAVHSTHHVGTTFRIVLPQGAAEHVPETASAVETAPLGASAADAVVNRLVLLAEDDPDIRKVTVMALRAAGYEVLATENGRLAVDTFAQRANDVQVVLLDQEMPVMNGEEAFRAIRAIRPNVPIVVMTGYGAQAAREHFGALQPSGILGKPFTGRQLAEELGKAFRSSSDGTKG